MGDFSKISLSTAQKIHQVRQDVIFKDGVISAKIKALIAMVSGINARCEPCLKYYALKAKALGTTEGELGEILAVVSTTRTWEFFLPLLVLCVIIPLTVY